MLSDAMPGPGLEPGLLAERDFKSSEAPSVSGSALSEHSHIVSAGLTESHGLVTNLVTTRRRGAKAQRRAEWDRIREAFGYRCAYCGKKPGQLDREHMFPKKRGGDDSLENIVPACSRCNTVKGSRTPLEWFLTLNEKRPQRPRRTWPLSEEPCRRCGGQCERRKYGKTGADYDRCGRCRYEQRIQPQVGAL